MFFVDFIVVTLAFYGIVRLLVARIRDDRISARGLAAVMAASLASTPIVYWVMGVFVAPWWEVLLLAALLSLWASWDFSGERLA